MLVTSRTPLRVSLFGGGSDYPEWYDNRPGAVLGFAIDKYIYISALRLPEFVDYRYRLSYSRLEHEQAMSDLQHPAVRAALETYGYDAPLDISVQADLPANSGLGSSSAFAVGFLSVVSALQETPRSRFELAQLAIDLEHKVLKERVGIQDQLHAAFGGFNRFDFHGKDLRVSPVRASGEALDSLTDWMLLVFTGVKRHASTTLEEQIDRTADHVLDDQLSRMVELVDIGEKVFENESPDRLPYALAELLDESWKIKRELASSVSNTHIDELLERCKSLGAIGGKLCGAGAGGFLLVIVPPDSRAKLMASLGENSCVPFRIAHEGSSVRQQW